MVKTTNETNILLPKERKYILQKHKIKKIVLKCSNKPEKGWSAQLVCIMLKSA